MPKWEWPCNGPVTSPFGPRWGRLHAGIDIGVAGGTPIQASLDGKVTQAGDSGGGYGVEVLIDHGTRGGSEYVSRYAHLSKTTVNTGDNVAQGDRVGLADSTGSSFGDHLHFEIIVNGQPRNPEDFLGEQIGDNEGGDFDPDTAADALSMEDIFAIGRAAAVSSWLELPGTTDTWQARMMGGDKSIFNDQPLLPFIQQLCEASTRHFQSLPDGSFFAFFPDYFGNYNHREPYWNIKDIEIIEGGIDLSDEALATHIFVTGDMNFDNQVDFHEKILSRGVFTIRDAFAAGDRVINAGDKKKQNKEDYAGFTFLDGELEARQFLEKYGQRPHIEDATFIKNPAFEFFYAFTTFQLLWSKQFITQFSFTFMPELYPGGIVAFDDHGFQAYIDNVTHTFDYTSGFTTTAMLSAPSAYGNDNDGISQGMVRPFAKHRWKRNKDRDKDEPKTPPYKPPGTEDDSGGTEGL